MVSNKKKAVKRANLNTRISLNTFRGASTPAEVRALLRHHRIGVHPNKYVTDHNRRRATEQAMVTPEGGQKKKQREHAFTALFYTCRSPAGRPPGLRVQHRHDIGGHVDGGIPLRGRAIGELIGTVCPLDYQIIRRGT